MVSHSLSQLVFSISGPCEDLDTTACQLALMYGGCPARKGKMANICRKTCNICGMLPYDSFTKKLNVTIEVKTSIGNSFCLD